jgi:pyridoxal phosphate enzyme (YggS family)
MNNISDRVESIKSTLPLGVQLIAVSKYHPAEMIREAYDAGQRLFGENHVQEMAAKQPLLPADIQWHMIGHLQTNKVKYMISFVTMIHSVDSLKLLREINKQAQKANRTVDCLLQLHVAQEEAKFGFTLEECRQMLAEGEWRQMNNVRLCGVMGMATNTNSDDEVKDEFIAIHNFFTEIKTQYFVNEPFFKEISMGMSNDYSLAVQCGSTMVRVGTSIFGARQY